MCGEYQSIKAVFMARCVCRLGPAHVHKAHGAWTLPPTSASRRSHSCATDCSSAPTASSVSPRCSSAPPARGAPGSWRPPPQARQGSPAPALSPAQALSPARLEHCATACCGARTRARRAGTTCGTLWLTRLRHRCLAVGVWQTKDLF
jgi:hypothetical protein